MPPARRALRLLCTLLAPHRGRIALAATALLVAAGAMLAVGQGLRSVIDQGIADGDPAWLDRTLLFMLATITVLAIATYVRFYNVSWLGERITADLRRRVFDHLLRLPPAWFEAGRTGDVISRLTGDTALIESVVGSSLSMALRNVLLLAGSLVMLLTTSLKLALLTLAGVPLVVLPILLFGRRVRRLSRLSQAHVAELGNRIDESIHEIRLVQAYGHEALDRAAFAERVEAGFDTARARIRMRARLVAAVLLLVFGGVTTILWLGGHDVLAGQLSPGELSAFIFYAALLAGSVGALSEVWGDLQRALGAAERLLELLDTPAAIRPPTDPLPLPEPGRGEITFRQVVFRYPGREDNPALDLVDFAIAPGETVALVGPSGAGKSTVYQLLMRFYDPASGSVQIDGVDIARADPARVRARMALVSQDPVVFATSVRENVRYGRPEARDEEVEAACHAAHATAFIDRLPDRLDTELGERGVRLSGGQRQRIAIARAILADRPILLLDEATSSLDADSERLVQAALDGLMRTRTTLVIAHRLATVRRADRILVFDQGRIVESGDHETLLAHGGLYAHLAGLQFGVTKKGE
ncbi:MAG: ATP-binding cassette domain-containing protein [Rhodocyclaceae bacterium]|nr:ATP-binding cassette domain-containing protein [Rhodocyclaceae bacterium]